MTKIINKIGKAKGSTQVGVLFAGKEEIREFMTNYLETTLGPALKEDVESIREQCVLAIKDVVNQNIVERIKSEVQIETQKSHIQQVKERFEQENIYLHSPKTKREAIEKAELAQDWINNVGDVPETDEELSKIWEGWFIEMNTNSDVADQKRTLEIMKTLTAEEAKLMWGMERRGKIKYKTLNRLKEDEKTQYLINLLQKKELITKVGIINPTSIIPLSILLCIISISIPIAVELESNFYFPAGLLNSPFFIIGLIFMVICIVGLAVLKKRYRLTWLGEKIVSYAKKKRKFD